MGLLFRSGGFSHKEPTTSRLSAGEDAVTFEGEAAAKGSSGDTLGRLLESGNTRGLGRTREMLAFVDGLKPGEIETRIEEALARRKGHQGFELIHKLYQKWVEQDAAAALRHAEGLEGRDRKTALDAVLAAWAEKEPYEALAWIEEHGADIETHSVIDAALRAIAREDPEKAIAFFESRKTVLSAKRTVFSGGGSYSMEGISPHYLYGIWAEKDPQAAASHALSIPHALDRKIALNSLAAQWALADPRAAWDWGQGMEQVSERDAVLQCVVGAVLENGDTSQAIAFLDAMVPGPTRRQALGKIANYLANSDPERAYDFVRSQALSTGEEEVYSSILSQWARTDPARAFQIALEDLEPGSARNFSLQFVLCEVARTDAATALEMLGKLDDGVLFHVSSSVAETLAQNDRSVAIAWAESLPTGDIQRSAFADIFSDWAQVAPEEAGAYGLKIADDSVRRRSLRSTLWQWGQQDAVEAMTWAVSKLGKEDQVNVIPDLLGTWADQDTEGAAAWVLALPEGKLRDESVSNLVSHWASQDLVATGEWLKRVPSGEGRDQATQDYASRVFETDPEAALIWAESIGKEGVRQREVESLARRYLRKDPEKARIWIANSSLAQGRKAVLLEKANPK
jgi:hypothetical protein